ncbi:MAG: 16S rRNA (cytosine(967)-C(5))-methyltransferase RsmB [Betaproteobacteria bacterium]|nr:16S rRNA (cytosine(967)-C(5))-methyltransferase RsmB [Betaproteobacteria bacterium]
MAPLAEALAAAARRVARVAAGRRLDPVEEAGEDLDEARNLRAATADLCYATLRRYGRSQAIVAALSHRGQSADPLIEALLWCALSALESKRYADYTVLDQAGLACERLELARAKGYVNALLRAFQRGGAAMAARLQADPQARWQHPRWWIESLRAEYPQAWQAILEAGNGHPPMCLRVNSRRITTEAYHERLAAEGIEAQRIGPSALLLAKPLPAARLPGHAEGLVSVQDAGAQRAAACLDLKSGQRVLDACAAPGGKTAHILESADVALTALDADPVRCRDVAKLLGRLGLAADVRAVDCTETGRWWDGKPYERILADVPCTATGIVRRHPDIKWLRRPTDAGAFAARQARILEALWRVLAPGGKLLYVTCSVFGMENGAVVDAFVASAAGARRLPLADGGAAQLLPGAAHDGFYFALLEKPA